MQVLGDLLVVQDEASKCKLLVHDISVCDRLGHLTPIQVASRCMFVQAK
jgi:hypothetical protein